MKAARQQTRVLVVEDERDVAELIRYNLTKEGYDVILAPTGGDALKQARQIHPDLVLLDIMVPQLNGWELCWRLKEDGDTNNIPVIMVTGRVEEGDKVLGFEMGADDYVTKPFSPRELLARIRAVARRGRAGDAEKKLLVKIGSSRSTGTASRFASRGAPWS
jgi:DNA-binding response OmpR family regulator